jgi:hypothetical protein
MWRRAVSLSYGVRGVDLGGWGWLGVRLRQLLSGRFGSLQWLFRCGTTSSETAQVDLIVNELHGLQQITAASPA